MKIDHELIALVSGVIAMLVLSSVISCVLIRRAGGTPSPALINLRSRVRAWWGMVAVFGVMLALGKNTLFGMYLLLSFLALREYITLSPTPRADHRTLTWVFFVILPLHYLFAWAPWYGMFTIFIPVYAFVFIPVRSAMAGDVDRFLERTSRIQWGVLTCIYFLSHLPMLLYLPIPGLRRPKRETVVLCRAGHPDERCFPVRVRQIGGTPQNRARTSAPGKTWEGLDRRRSLSAVALGTRAVVGHAVHSALPRPSCR